MTALYVPPTEESDHKKQNQSLQLIGGVVATLNAATYVNSFKARTGVVVPVQGDYPTSLIPGTTTNDSATAGNLGEYIESAIAVGSAVAFTTNVQANITSISLTAGDWDVDAIAYYKPAATTSITRWVSSVGTTSATIDATSGRFSDVTTAAFVPGGNNMTNPIPAYRFSLSATTTIFLVGLATFTVSTLTAYGLLRARRVR